MDQEVGVGLVGSLVSRALLAQFTSDSTSRCKAIRVERRGCNRARVRGVRGGLGGISAAEVQGGEPERTKDIENKEKKPKRLRRKAV